METTSAFGLLAHDRDALRALTQCGKAGDMVGMQVCVDGLYQPEVQLLEELNVAINLFEDRVDDKRLSTVPARDEIAVGTLDAIEQLPKNPDEAPAHRIPF